MQPLTGSLSKAGSIIAATALLLVAGVIASAPASADTGTFTVGNNPASVAFSPDGSAAYVTNDLDAENPGSVSVINPNTGQVAATIPVGINPHGVSVSKSGARVYVANYSSHTVSVIDTATKTVTATITGFKYPERIALTADGSTAYVSNGSPGTTQQGTKTVSVVNLSSNAVTATIPVGEWPTALALSPDGTQLYALNHVDSTISAISTASNTVTGTITLPWYPQDVKFSPDGSKAYVSEQGASSNSYTASLSVIDVASARVIQTISYAPATYFPTPNGGADRGQLALTPDGQSAYITNLVAGTVSVINLARMKEGAPLAAGKYPRDIAISPTGNAALVANGGSASVTRLTLASTTPPTTARVSGGDRFTTAVSISQQSYPGTAPVVYVASGLGYPDALGAGPAAVKQGGPLLLTTSWSLPDATAAEIRRLHPSQIVVVGGPNSVSGSVYSALSKLAPSITRVTGGDRFATNKALLSYAFPGNNDTVYVASGLNFPDALSASAISGSTSSPVVLINTNLGHIDAETMNLIRSMAPFNIVTAGGGISMPPYLVNDLRSIANVTENDGSDRFATSQMLNEGKYSAANPPKNVYLANGLNFPDALAGGALAAKEGSALFTVPGWCIPQRTLADIQSWGIKSVTLLGGNASLSTEVANLSACGANIGGATSGAVPIPDKPSQAAYVGLNSYYVPFAQCTDPVQFGAHDPGPQGNAYETYDFSFPWTYNLNGTYFRFFYCFSGF
ncbi:cell wall-binding repeat-containing protein [Leifsonia sp. NPDC014704]|uniref:Cell wall-binding repeat-containing protein n=1 Tax=Leifsonia virtsii TaxID=3035915 RepID=A0ABT8J2F9_9MICO|nr:cell wall-binding repeat-containing protein [Leifsonia virtsii]MDN4599270.1 cell wall-binding repeat-containing protein [Leifsonia virtsii]